MRVARNTELLVPHHGPLSTKDRRYYLWYYFDQYLYQSNVNPQVGWGIFWQVAPSGDYSGCRVFLLARIT
jgi:hypothetical protein